MKKHALLFLIFLSTNMLSFSLRAEDGVEYYYDNDVNSLQIVNEYEDGLISDPFELLNRLIFNFNEMIDTLVLDPTANFYLATFPQPIQNNVSSFYLNLAVPLTAVNQLLQGDFSGSVISVMRFVTNVVLGFGGVVDIATEFDMPNANEDFGKTLGFYGGREGPYLVLPIFGPSNVRDLIGKTADYYIDPTTKIVRKEKYLVLSAGKLIYIKSYNYNLLNNLRSNSLDYYTTIKSLYTQNRRSQINKSKGK
jgi:phospholipid-binding lipoprotein MlaA